MLSAISVGEKATNRDSAKRREVEATAAAIVDEEEEDLTHPGLHRANHQDQDPDQETEGTGGQDRAHHRPANQEEIIERDQNQANKSNLLLLFK